MTLSVRVQKIKDELTLDPEGRVYSGMTDQQATDDLNELRYASEVDVGSMINYLATHKNRTNEGGDTTASAILGRLEAVAAAAVGTDPFFRGGYWEAEAGNLSITWAPDPASTITFGAGHDISGIQVKDPIILFGFGSDNDGMYRIQAVSGQVITLHASLKLENPEGATDYTINRVAWVAAPARAKLVTQAQQHAARAIYELVRSNLISFDFTDTEVAGFFTEIEGAGVWKAADTTALTALSQGLESRAIQIGAPNVRIGEVEQARA